jgi:diguanylate cyclase (GGDEF)-like protein
MAESTWSPLVRPVSRGATGRTAYARLLVALVVGVVPAAVLSLGLKGDPSGPGPFVGLAIITMCAATALMYAAATSERTQRVTWAALSVALALSAGVQLANGLAASSSTSLTPSLHLLGLVACLLGLVAQPGVKRSLRGWMSLGIDGWLVGGSLFGILWMREITSERLLMLPPGFRTQALLVMVDFAVVSILVGLARRVPGSKAADAWAFVIAGLLMANGDFYRTFFSPESGGLGRPAYVGSWALAVVLIAAVPWIGDEPPYQSAQPEPPTARTVRLPYALTGVAFIDFVLHVSSGRPVDGVTVVVSLSLIVALQLSLMLLARENLTLYSQAAVQAADFRIRATRDSLTGLPNREEFSGHVERALDGPGRDRVAVLFVDLDGFKDVNDSFGHQAGDGLLVQTAERLSGAVREGDVVARFGGDEFVALLAHCSDEDAVRVAERFREELSRPYKVAGRELVVSASIGLSRPGPSDDADDALRNADLALYQAKAAGRDRVVVFEQSMHTSAVRRLEGAARLRKTLADGRLRLAYQPVVDLRTGSIRGMEALLRFQDDDMTGWTVAEAVAAAEESGLIIPLGLWVLNCATAQIAQWQSVGLDVAVAINVSARQLDGSDFVAEVSRTLARHGVSSSNLHVELTENQLVRDFEDSTRELSRLRALGVKVSLDDFGTGYSSLSYLTQLPLDGLKLDRALVERAGGARDIVPSVLRLGRDLGLSVVAEGVETIEQLIMLREVGATLGQGFLLSHPLGVEDATAILRRGRVPLAIRPEPIFVPHGEMRRQSP